MERSVYSNAIEAYKAIHCGLAAAVESALENCEYKEAIQFADAMRQLELDHLVPYEDLLMQAHPIMYYPEGDTP